MSYSICSDPRKPTNRSSLCHLDSTTLCTLAARMPADCSVTFDSAEYVFVPSETMEHLLPHEGDDLAVRKSKIAALNERMRGQGELHNVEVDHEDGFSAHTRRTMQCIALAERVVGRVRQGGGSVAGACDRGGWRRERGG